MDIYITFEEIVDKKFKKRCYWCANTAIYKAFIHDKTPKHFCVDCKERIEKEQSVN